MGRYGRGISSSSKNEAVEACLRGEGSLLDICKALKIRSKTFHTGGYGREPVESGFYGREAE